MPGAWLRLDRHGQLLHASSAAHELLAANADVLAIVGQRLQALREPDRLDQLLQQWHTRGLGAAALTRDDRLPLTLLCQRLPAGQQRDPHAGGPGGGLDDDHGLLTLRDPEAEQPDIERVRSLFALTPSEAVVAVGLALGHSSADIAQRMGIQPNTVLTHVKRVLAKTGTRRQAQLVSLLLRSVAVVPLAGRALPALAPPVRGPGLAVPVELGMSLT